MDDNVRMPEETPVDRQLRERETAPKPKGPTLDERIAELEADVKKLRSAMKKSDARAAEVREAVAPRLVARGIEP